jgi:hypothetical protein
VSFGKCDSRETSGNLHVRARACEVHDDSHSGENRQGFKVKKELTVTKKVKTKRQS